MARSFDPPATFLWIGIALIVFDVYGAAAAGGVFIGSSLLSEWLAPE